MFGAGVLIGSVLSYFLFQYAAMVERPREVRSVEVVVTACDLAPGDVFEERCAEKRVVAERFVPPDTVLSDQIGLYVGRRLEVALEKGSAVRTVDFQPE